MAVAANAIENVERLTHDGCHLWWAETAGVDAVGLERCREWLSDEERARLERFVFERDRQVFLLTHAMLRDVLHRYLGERPDVWRFVAAAGGKPAIDSPRLSQRVTFNLSHSQEVALCGVAINREIGVDVEDMERLVEFAELANRYFAGSEAADVLRRMSGDRRRRFFEYWTLKEAILKGEGAGLKGGMSGFAIQFGTDGTVDATERVGERWDLKLVTVRERYAMAVALERRDERMTPRLFEWRPPPQV